MDFSVWAPSAGAVDLDIAGSKIPMQKAPTGWWLATADAQPGVRYGFSIDGGPSRPDPRSPSQPDGIFGLSEVIDHAAFQWTDQWWRGVSLRGSILYELHIGTFTENGTFESAIKKLPHLRDLGVDAVELLPVAEFSGGRGWGYDGVDLFAPHHSYGGPDGLKRFIDACHRARLGVIIDVVYNHLGPAGNFLAEFGPYFSEVHTTNWGRAINFDGPGSDEVRRFVIDNALMWLRDYHADGVRLDAIHAIVDQSAQHVLGELTDEVDVLATQLRRPLFVIGESDLNDPRFVHSREAGGLGLDAVWADEWHHALHAVLTGDRSGYYEDFGSLTLLAKALRQAWVYDGTWSPHRGRHHGASPKGLHGYQFVVFTQNHDQVGNRARGERSARLMSDGRLRVAAALLLTSPFTPLLFQGEEWACSSPFLYFTDHGQPELAGAVSQGRRKEFSSFGWSPEGIPDPQAEESFRASKLEWSELELPTHASMLGWYRELLALRRQIPELSDPRLSKIHVAVNEESGTLIVSRDRAVLYVNLGTKAQRFEVEQPVSVLASSQPEVRVDGCTLEVPSDAVAIVLRNAPRLPGNRHLTPQIG